MGGTVFWAGALEKVSVALFPDCLCNVGDRLKLLPRGFPARMDSKVDWRARTNPFPLKSHFRDFIKLTGKIMETRLHDLIYISTQNSTSYIISAQYMLFLLISGVESQNNQHREFMPVIADSWHFGQCMN